MTGYKAHIVIARKDLNIFTRKHNSNPTEFYFHVLHHLLNAKLKDTYCKYNLYLSQRGNNSLGATESKAGNNIKYNLEIVPSKDMPELSITRWRSYLLKLLGQKMSCSCHS